MQFKIKQRYDINDFVSIVEYLRSENGCPWDKEQNHHSIRQNLIEETYEAVEAIDTNNTELLREELGDVLLQVVFHSQMEREVGGFNFDDVVNEVAQKLVIRHPHVFGDVAAKDVEQVLVNWANIKKQQKGQKTDTQYLRSVSKALPALMRGEKILHRAAKIGYSLNDSNLLLEQLKQKVRQLEVAVIETKEKNIDEQIGEVIFGAIAIANNFEVCSEHSLEKTCDNFINRFETAENYCKNSTKSIKDLTIRELLEYYSNANKNL